jgi:hypothetical protein
VKEFKRFTTDFKWFFTNFKNVTLICCDKKCNWLTQRKLIRKRETLLREKFKWKNVADLVKNLWCSPNTLGPRKLHSMKFQTNWWRLSVSPSWIDVSDCRQKDLSKVEPMLELWWNFRKIVLIVAWPKWCLGVDRCDVMKKDRRELPETSWNCALIANFFDWCQMNFGESSNRHLNVLLRHQFGERLSSECQMNDVALGFKRHLTWWVAQVVWRISQSSRW